VAARKRKKTKRKPVKAKKNQASNTFGRWFKKLLLGTFVILLFLFLSYTGYLDYNLREKFEGRRWAIPAKVYASPTELYSGYNITATQFEKLLQQLHYRLDYQLASPGSYYKQGSQVNVKTRSFRFWDADQKSQSIRVNFSSGRIVNIIDLVSTNPVAIVRMDPVQIASFYPTRKEDRVLIKLEQAPDSLVQGLLATEDRDFYHHFGLSPRAIARATLANIRAGSIVQGGSTITQQLIKNFYLTSERSWWRKINEALMALILDFHYSKDEILEAYLNEVYLGQDGASAVHGFGLASEFYFGRPLQNLPLHQVAALVALVRGPSYYDLRRYTKRAISRRNLVLDKMHEQGFITLRQTAEAKRQKIDVIAYTHRAVNRYPGFIDLVQRHLRQEYREDDLTSEGLRIFTTLDIRVQNVLEQTLETKLNELEKRPKSSKLEAAAIVTRRENGEIAALAGGRNKGNAGFNRALDAVRPIGSLIKPVVYLTALEYPEKYTIISRVSDRSFRLKGKKGKIWAPRNYDRKEHGDVQLHTALAHSYNLATVRVGLDIGIARIAKTLRSLGVTRRVNLFPSLLLGASPLTPIEVTQMYQTLAGDGFATPLRSIHAVISSEGEVLQRYPFTIRQVVDPAATYITNSILQEVMREGTGRSAYLYLPQRLNLIGKTGTTNALRDSWFSGYSGDFLSTIWIGRDDNKPTGLTGSSGALQVWISLMGHIAKQSVDLIAPDNVEMVWIDPENDLHANEQCAGAKQYPFIANSAPVQNSPCINSPVNQVKEWFDRFLEENDW
jgi:penicillin-binding protein 1B